MNNNINCLYRQSKFARYRKNCSFLQNYLLISIKELTAFILIIFQTKRKNVFKLLNSNFKVNI